MNHQRENSKKLTRSQQARIIAKAVEERVLARTRDKVTYKKQKKNQTQRKPFKESVRGILTPEPTASRRTGKMGTSEDNDG